VTLPTWTPRGDHCGALLRPNILKGAMQGPKTIQKLALAVFWVILQSSRLNLEDISIQTKGKKYNKHPQKCVERFEMLFSS